MKRYHSEEISVYSTSAIDLFCSAMGVFMIICFAVLAQNSESASAGQTPETRTAALTKKGLSTPVMIAQCTWNKKADVDLMVRYTGSAVPAGQKAVWFAYDDEISTDRRDVKVKVKRRAHPHFYGGLLRDALYTDADKVEQWSLLASEPGTYEVYVSLLDNGSRGEPPPVTTRVTLMTEDEEIQREITLSEVSPRLAEDVEADTEKRLTKVGSFIVSRKDDRFNITLSQE